MATDPFAPLHRLPTPDQWDEITRRAQVPSVVRTTDLRTRAPLTWRRTGTRALAAAAAVVLLVVVGAPRSEDRSTTVNADQAGEGGSEVTGNRVLRSACTVHFAGDLPIDMRAGFSPVWSITTASTTGSDGSGGADEDGNPIEEAEWEPEIVGHGELLDGSATFEIGIAHGPDLISTLAQFVPHPELVAKVPTNTGDWLFQGFVSPARETVANPVRPIVLPPVLAGRRAAVGVAVPRATHPDGTCPYRFIYIAAIGGPGVDQAALEQRVLEMFRVLQAGSP